MTYTVAIDYTVMKVYVYHIISKKVIDNLECPIYLTYLDNLE